MTDHHLLQLDEVTLSTGASEWVEYDGYRIRTLATDAEFGNPVPVVEELGSGLVTGSLEWVSDWENVDPTFQVEVQAPDAAGLAAGGAMLALACASARELRWTPPAANGAVTVHDLQHARIEHQFDDMTEMEDGRAPVRVVQIRMAAQPFPRSAELTVVEPIGSGTGTTTPTPVVTVLHTPTSTAGWSGASMAVPPKPPAISYDPAVGVGGVANYDLALLQYAGSLAMESNRWLRVKFRSSRAISMALITKVGTTLTTWRPTAVIGQYAYYHLPSGFGTATQLSWSIPRGAWLYVSEIARQDIAPFVSNTRQLIQQFEVGGTAPTQGSLELWHETLALGQTMIYTWPDDTISGYTPPIGQMVVTATQPTPGYDGSATLGQHWPLTSTNSVSFDVPASQLPEGDYSVLVRGKIDSGDPTAVTVRVTASTRIGGNTVGTQSDQRWSDWAPTYRILSTGILTLPPTKVAGARSTATVRITINLPTAGDKLKVDNVYLINTDLGDLTVIDCGTGTPVAGGASNRAWLDAATNEGSSQRAPRSPIYVGTLADRTDARHIAGTSTIAAVAHRWPAGERVNVLTVSMATDVATRLSYYRRWVGYAA